MDQTRKLWMGLIALLLSSFALLLWMGGEMHRQAPPMPERVVAANGEVLFTRAFLSLLLFSAFILPTHGLGVMRTRRYGAHLLRGVSQTTSQTLLLIAFSMMPLASATAINFSAPLFATLTSILLLKEPAFERAVLLAPLVRAAEWRWVKVAHWLGNRFLESVPRRFGINSGDRDFLEFVSHRDPLQPRRIPVRWVEAMLRWERRFEQLPSSEQQVLIVQGQKDNTVDWRHNIPVVREKFPRAKYLPLQEAHHHLVNETVPLRAKIFAAIDLYLG